MSFYITLLSDQAQGTGQKFTARLPRSYYLVEDDWEVALVHMSHPGFNQSLEDQTKQNWTQEDSQKHWMKTDVRYIPKREVNGLKTTQEHAMKHALLVFHSYF